MKNHKLGFTLIEILIALLILAIISVMMATGLHSAIRSQDQLSRRSAQITNVQKGMLIIERDIEQIINRPILDTSGQRLPAVMVKYQNGKLILEFTRAGFINPFNMQNRTTMQRVSYTLNGSDLIRTSWAELDRMPNTPQESQIIMNDVNSFKIQFLDQKLQLSVPNETSLQLNSPLPLAIEVNLEVKGIGSVIRFLPLSL